MALNLFTYNKVTRLDTLAYKVRLTFSPAEFVYLVQDWWFLLMLRLGRVSISPVVEYLST